MSTEAEQPKTTVEELAARFRGEMIPLTSKFSYFSTLPMAEDDLRQYLNDPIAAISPAIVSRCCRQWASSWRPTSKRATARRATR